MYNIPLEIAGLVTLTKDSLTVLLVGLKEKEVQFIRNMVLNAVDNMKLLTE